MQKKSDAERGEKSVRDVVLLNHNSAFGCHYNYLLRPDQFGDAPPAAPAAAAKAESK